MPNAEALQLGAIGIICVVLIREVFAFLKARKNGNGFTKDILKQVQLMNENHLNSICEEIKLGNENIVNAINTMNRELGDKMDNVNAGIARLLGRSDLK